MLKLEEELYDLNFLFSCNIDFKMLKEVLLKLAKKQTNLEKEIKSLKISNVKRDKKIAKLLRQLRPSKNDNKNKDDENEEPFEDTSKNIETNQNNEEKNEEEKKEQEKNEEEKKEEDKNNEEKNEEGKNNEEKSNEEITENEINQKEEQQQNNNNKIYQKLPTTNTKAKKPKNIETESSDEDSNIHPLTEQNKIPKRSLFNLTQGSSNSGIKPEIINSILSSIQNLSNKIKSLNNKLIYKIRDEVFPIKKQINNINSQNIEDHRFINEQINELNKKQVDLAEKIEDCLSKIENIDPLELFQDNGDGTVDAAKALFKSLEDKVFKKFELMETKNKEENEKNLMKNQLIDDLKTMFEKQNKELSDLKDETIKNKNESNNLIKNLDNLLKTNNDSIAQKYKDLDTKFNNCFSNPNISEDKLKNILNNKDLNKEEKQETENISEKSLDKLNKKILDLYNKVREIDVLLKTTVNNHGQELNDINESLTEMKDNYNKKITKEDLKELYSFYYDHVNQLKHIDEKISDLTDNMQKLKDDYSFVFKRTESLSRDIIELKNKEFSDISNKPIDMSKFIDEYKLKELMKPYKNEIENLIKETDSLNSNLSSTKEEMELLASKDYVNKIEGEINEKINDLLNKISKKYIDKTSFDKTMKNVDIQLKLLSDNNNKDSDGWILAKQPLGCFNCASCEANIKNISPSSEFLPWNKYPQGEKQYRLGHGFSKLLKKISASNDLNIIRNYERNEFLGDDLLYSSITNNLSKKSFMGKSCNKEMNKDDSYKNSPRNYKLPNVIINNKIKKDIPLTDEEKEHSDGSIVINNNKSPKIVKITKKTATSNNGQIFINGPPNIRKNMDIEQSRNKMNATSLDKHQLSRVQSLPIY